MKRGFSLLELLLVIALIVVISGLSFPFLISYQRSAIVSEDSTKIVNLIRRAQSLSTGGYLDDGWSFKIQSGVAYIYKGTDFGARDQNLDEITTLSSQISITGVTEFNFEKLTGWTQDEGDLSLSVDDNIRVVNVTGKGAVSY